MFNAFPFLGIWNVLKLVRLPPPPPRPPSAPPSPQGTGGCWMILKGTHNQSQSIQTQFIKSLFSIQICSINLTLGTVKV